MQRPNFTVVTSVLIVFAILAFARHAFMGFIPPVTTNPLAYSDQRFLSMAGHEEIKWHLVEQDAFELAKRTDKPILLVIGVSSTNFGRQFDQMAFGDTDTARFVLQNFFCIRIDGFEHPEWVNAILPVSRLQLGFSPGFQVWTLDSSGHVFSLIGKNSEANPLDSKWIYTALIRARDQAREILSRRASGDPIQDLQSDDLVQIASRAAFAWPSLSAYAEVLGTRCDRVHGGFPRNDVQRLYPNAWRFLSLTGNTSLWRASVDPLLISPMVDVQDGGFFRIGHYPEIRQVEFSKNTRQNAEMMGALALQSHLTHDPFYRRLAESTFDWLLFSAGRNGMLAACQEDDENPQNRSPRLSFPTWRLHDLLSPSDLSWAADRLGLNPMTNTQMVPYFKSRGTLLDNEDEFNRVLTILRQGTTDQPTFNDNGYLDVNGLSLARMLETARLWSDRKRLSELGPYVAKVLASAKTPELMHRANVADGEYGYLGDYLAVSDMMLQDYLVTGDPSVLKRGLLYLNVARSRFHGALPGNLNLSSGVKAMGGFAGFQVPEIADNLAESCTAQAIRLELDYGRMTADTPSGRDLLRSARQTTAAFSAIAGKGGPDAGGYFCAAAQVLDDTYAVAVGPTARDLADELFRLSPTRFVAPAIGSFRPDLQRREPGIYVIGSKVEGPFSVEDAADRLPLSLVHRRSP